MTQATPAEKGALPGATPLELPLQKGSERTVLWQERVTFNCRLDLKTLITNQPENAPFRPVRQAARKPFPNQPQSESASVMRRGVGPRRLTSVPAPQK